MNKHGYISWSAIPVLLFMFGVFLFATNVDAATIERYSDTITDSGPGEYSDHTIRFTTTVEIPAGGYVRFIPSPTHFTIPAVNFDVDNVELLTSSGAGFTARNTGTTTDATTDGVAITTGTSGQIEITLNSTTGISAGSIVQMKIGTITSNATTTDVGLVNPNATGTFPIAIETGGGGNSESVTAFIALVGKVGVGPIDTRETDPPVRYNGAPSGELSGTTVTVQMSLETDEFSQCRYSSATGTPFYSMSKLFTSSYVTIHSEEIPVATSTSYTYFVRCIDDEGNANTDDYVISFSIPEYPEGTPGSTGSGEDIGEGEGTGSGSSGSGSGSSSGDGSGGESGASSGGSGGGGSGGGSSGGEGSGGGGFEGTKGTYQSGDGQVIVNGYAFPNKDVVVLVDGVKAEEGRADSSGRFSVTIDQIARGVYTFGVYAVDSSGTKSSTYSTTFSVTGSRASTLSNIHIMPSINVDPDPVDPGTQFSVSGHSIPNATITIENQNDKSSVSLKTFTTTSDSSGAWSIDVDATGFQTGTYKVRAKAKQESGVSTNYSNFTYYGVGEQAVVSQSSDLNGDNAVNLVDFSILLFWWNTDGGASNPSADINQDGNVSLTDFSIMIFNWTG